MGSIPGLGRSPGEGKGCPLQCSGLENLGLYSPWGSKRSDTTERLSLKRKLRDNEHNMFLFKDKEIGFSGNRDFLEVRLKIKFSWRNSGSKTLVSQLAT